MLKRVILTSSNPGDAVLDCFAGSGETLLQAHQLGRRFIGMDNSGAAQAVIRRRLDSAGIDAEWIDLEESSSVSRPSA